MWFIWDKILRKDADIKLNKYIVLNKLFKIHYTTELTITHSELSVQCVSHNECCHNLVHVKQPKTG